MIIEKDPDDSVRNEQSGATEDARGTERNTNAEEIPAAENIDNQKGLSGGETAGVRADSEQTAGGQPGGETAGVRADSEQTAGEQPGGETAGEEQTAGVQADSEQTAGEQTGGETAGEEQAAGAQADSEQTAGEQPGKEDGIPVRRKRKTVQESEIQSGSEEHGSEVRNLDDIELPPVDYSGFSKNDLVDTLALLIDNRPPSEIRNDVDRLKVFFYKKLKQEAEERKNKFLEGGGTLEDYRSWVDPLEARVKHLLDKYRQKKTDFNRVQEAEKYENLKKKYEIIDKIKELVNREESINKTFNEFRLLQSEWHSIGVVPQNAVKHLWENYHHHVEIFYDYIKINKELRDLDLKKNLETKVLLCEKAEELLLEPNPVNAFRILQEYHNQWREIGPVPVESKNEIWERFREATSQINKRHYEYFEKQKDVQRRNLEAKIALCEEVEEINLLEITNFKDFDEKAEKIMALQKMWRTIGFAPKKQNNKVYQRFRDACDSFFDKKRNFYADNKEIQQNNLQLKIDLCLQAEALQDSTDWKATTDALIKLQKNWKDVGPVPRKQSEKLWKRFRRACDHFFDKKSEFFSDLDTSYEDNLNAKLALIQELEKFETGTDVQEAFERLKDIQRRWAEIGFVPFNRKDEITNKYRIALNKEFDRLKIGDEDKSILKFRSRLENLKTNPKASRKIRNERDKFFTKIKQLENDIVLWENNIGFFTKSPSAETMIREVREKIDNAKKMIKILEEKVKMIDQSEFDDYNR
ncbi:MAG: DUF349 domain-containing protein [Spirochaetia bacterium]|jgi:hypothetical protein|nr:DUF349 domain-containing protein [Spirochaetia bacterium]